jgi:uncharacterized RDD family membrane protein YckC
MTAWYYSDTQRNRLGPVAAADLALLHDNGQLAPEVLVWREGMPDWKPWREVMDEVLGRGGPARFAAPAPVDPALAAREGVNPYAMAEPRSPYAAPSAAVAMAPGVVQGGRVVYAGFLKRFAASIVDSFATTILSYALLIPLVMVMGVGMAGLSGLGPDASAGLGLGMMAGIYGVMLGVPALYFGWMQSSSWQATLGKRMADVKLVRGDGSPVGFWRAALRYLAMAATFALTCGLGALASAIMTAVTERRQALHDLICDTVVVDQHAYTATGHLQREELNTASIVVLVLYALLLVGVFAIAIGAGILGASS